MLNLKQTDNENRRVYYTNDAGNVLCFQEADDADFELFTCTAHGEPLFGMSLDDLEIDYAPAGDSSTAVAFRAWVARNNAALVE